MAYVPKKKTPVATPSGLGDMFSLAPEAYTHRTIASLAGEVGTGKTYFVCTGPAPILIQNIDKGTEGVVEQFRLEGKEIYVKDYTWNPGADFDDEDVDALRDLAREVRSQWEADFRYALMNGIRTIGWDTESRIWEVYRYAEFGSPNGDDIKDYGKLNQRFESLINEIKATDANLLLIRSMKNSWGMKGPVNAKTGKKSFGKGEREVWGYEHLPGIMMEEFFFERRPEGARTQSPKDEEYVIHIGKSRHNAKIQYTTQPRMTFPEMGTFMIDGSEESDWK